MSKRTTIRLVPLLQEELSSLAEEMDVSYNQLVNYALARFVESQKGISTLEERARRGSKSSFLSVMKKADRQQRRKAYDESKPIEDDQIPPGYTRKALIAWLEREKRRGSAAS